jgi:hypothetical protein
VFGGAGLLAASAAEVPYDLPTAVEIFLLTVALLYWQPEFG